MEQLCTRTCGMIRPNIHLIPIRLHHLPPFFLFYFWRATHISCYLTPSSGQISQSSYRSMLGDAVFRCDKTTLVCNDLEVDRSAARSDPSAQAWTLPALFGPSVCSPAQADQHSSLPRTLIICARPEMNLFILQ